MCQRPDHHRIVSDHLRQIEGPALVGGLVDGDLLEVAHQVCGLFARCGGMSRPWRNPAPGSSSIAARSEPPPLSMRSSSLVAVFQRRHHGECIAWGVFSSWPCRPPGDRSRPAFQTPPAHAALSAAGLGAGQLLVALRQLRGATVALQARSPAQGLEGPTAAPGALQALPRVSSSAPPAISSG